MTINIRDNDQTASTAEPEHVTPPGPGPYPMPPADPTPVAETDAGDDDEMDAEVRSDADGESRAEDHDEPDTETEPEDEPDLELELETGADDQPELEDEPHPELNTGAYGHLGADMYDEPEPGDEPEPETSDQAESDRGPGGDPDTEIGPEAAAAVGESQMLDVQDEVDLREAPTEVATEGRAVLDAGNFGERWNAIQTSFVDEPRQAVQSADHLVTEAIEDLAKILASQRDALQAQWRQGDDVDTEQLRVIFQDYRAFLHGLLPT